MTVGNPAPRPGAVILYKLRLSTATILVWGPGYQQPLFYVGLGYQQLQFWFESQATNSRYFIWA